MSSEPLLQLSGVTQVSCWLIGLLFSRSLVPALWLVTQSRASARFRWSVAAALALALAPLLASGAAELAQLGALLACVVYFSALGWVACIAAERSWCDHFTKPALFALCALSFILVPGLVVPSLTLTAGIAYGFELMLTTYSYLVESAQRGTHSPRKEALFFMLVNPVLVFPERGRVAQAAGPSRRASGRLALGALGVFGTFVIARAFVFIDAAAGADWAEAHPALHFGLAALATYLITYLGQSGIASVQIGWMGLHGWEVPERYRFPLLATSPVEFWQRWNTYFGSWLRRYVFAPVALACRRGFPRLPLVSTNLAVLSTFAISGLLHDYVLYPSVFTFPVGATLGFLLFGAGVVAWQSAARALSPLLNDIPRPLRAAFGACMLLPLLSAMHQLMTPGPRLTLPTAVAEWLGVRQLGF